MTTPNILWICALGLGVGAARSSSADAQAATTSREARATLNRSTTIKQLTTVDVPSKAPAARTTTEDPSIRPFRINVPDKALADLRRRILATQWPEKETVTDQSQGVPLATTQELARYWATDYDWRKVEVKLIALPQFTTTIDGLDIRRPDGLAGTRGIARHPHQHAGHRSS